MKSEPTATITPTPVNSAQPGVQYVGHNGRHTQEGTPLRTIAFVADPLEDPRVHRRRASRSGSILLTSGWPWMRSSRSRYVMRRWNGQGRMAWCPGFRLRSGGIGLGLSSASAALVRLVFHGDGVRDSRDGAVLPGAPPAGTPDLATLIRDRHIVDALQDRGTRTNRKQAAKRRTTTRVPDGYISIRATPSPRSTHNLNPPDLRVSTSARRPPRPPAPGSHPGGRRFEPG